MVQRYPSGLYQIGKLGGTILKESVAAVCLKLFRYRADQQSIKLPPALCTNLPPPALDNKPMDGVQSLDNEDKKSESVIMLLIQRPRATLHLANGSSLNVVTNACAAFEHALAVLPQQ